jgi:hypothetical protein
LWGASGGGDGAILAHGGKTVVRSAKAIIVDPNAKSTATFTMKVDKAKILAGSASGAQRWPMDAVNGWRPQCSVTSNSAPTERLPATSNVIGDANWTK